MENAFSGKYEKKFGNCIVSYHNPLQVKKQWALGNPEKIQKIITHNLSGKSPVPAEDVQQLFQLYRQRYLLLAENILRLETAMCGANKLPDDWSYPEYPDSICFIMMPLLAIAFRFGSGVECSFQN